ncbi:MAG: hypothetical protein CMJ59_22050 [Planctomycetaceae bacterium]|nr:hypothetical protein [Planctomycetaceae bacterium]
MTSDSLSTARWREAYEHLQTEGYVVIEGLLAAAQLAELRAQVAAQFEVERAAPPDPGPACSSLADDDLRTYFAQHYAVSSQELERILRFIRRTRHEQLDTPWPVPPELVNKTFLHLPTRFDHDRSQRIWNLLGKSTAACAVAEHAQILPMVRGVLGEDSLLSDCSATSVGAQTGGGAWHVDVPLGQLPEPLPDIPLTVQNAWMLDDFTLDNGATQVVPGSHRSRRKPPWSDTDLEGQITLTAPAGSVAIWLSNTWHRSGPNRTDQPRRAVLGYYCRSWIKPFHDFRRAIPRDRAARFSPTLRYLIGYAAESLVRGV